jgi:hypothetical protein
MAKVWTKEETMELIRLYESFPEIWDSRHMHYKDRDKRNVLAIDRGGSGHQRRRVAKKNT